VNITLTVSLVLYFKLIFSRAACPRAPDGALVFVDPSHVCNFDSRSWQWRIPHWPQVFWIRPWWLPTFTKKSRIRGDTDTGLAPIMH